MEVLVCKHFFGYVATVLTKLFIPLIIGLYQMAPGAGFHLLLEGIGHHKFLGAELGVGIRGGIFLLVGFVLLLVLAVGVRHSSLRLLVNYNDWIVQLFHQDSNSPELINSLKIFFELLQKIKMIVESKPNFEKWIVEEVCGFARAMSFLKMVKGWIL